MSKDILDEVYDMVGRVTHTLCEDYDALAVAAVLMVMGMRIYKTVLDDDDYKQIVKDVVDRQDKVFPLEARSTRGFD